MATTTEAAAEVKASKAELQDAEQAVSKVELELWDAQRRHELAVIRHDEAIRVLIEVTAE